MDLHCTQRGYDSIWVIVDRLTKVAHFLLVKTTSKVGKIVHREDTIFAWGS